MRAPASAIPRATYRVQLHAGFTFEDAAAIVGYLAELGISHLYTSPILQAAPGSTHGYDVIDHDRISDELGGEAGSFSGWGRVDLAHVREVRLMLGSGSGQGRIGLYRAERGAHAVVREPWRLRRYGDDGRHVGDGGLVRADRQERAG